MWLNDICTHRLNELLEAKRMRSKRRFRKFLIYNGSKLKEKSKNRTKENGGAANEQQRKSADDVIGKRYSGNGLHEDYGLQNPQFR